MSRRMLNWALLAIVGVAALVLYWLLKRDDEDDFDDMSSLAVDYTRGSDLHGDITIPPPWADNRE